MGGRFVFLKARLSRRKHLYLFLLALVVALASLAACSRPSGDSPQNAMSDSADSSIAAPTSASSNQDGTPSSADFSALRVIEAPDGHVVTDDFEFDIPEYWRGKVDVAMESSREGFPRVVLYLKGHTERSDWGDYKYALATVARKPNTADYANIDGDVGNHRVCHLAEGDVYVDVWTYNWVWMAWYEQNEKYAAQQTPIDMLATLVDLSTGGAVSYEQALASEPDSSRVQFDYAHDAFAQSFALRS